MTAAELHCAGCGARGHAPAIRWDKSAVPPDDVVIRPAFGWHQDGKPALLCDSCRARLAKRRKRGRPAP